MDEAAQLRHYAATGAQDAFAAVVQRYLPLVYAAALRRVGGDTHRAEDVAQLVFTALARNARSLATHPDLTGWLFTTTRFLAAKTVRGERRRQLREQAVGVSASAMSDEPTPENSAPLHAALDDVVMELRQLDRQIVLLRFHRGLRLAEIGAQLGASENAVQKRLERALEQLRDKLARRGITSTAAALTLAFEQQAAIAVPAGLAAAATTAGLACGAAAGSLLAFSGFMAVSKFQLAIAAAVIAATSGGVVWQVAENRALRAEAASQSAATVARTSELRARLASVTQRAESAEADAATLQKALHAAKTAEPAPRARVVTDAQDQANADMRRADQLAREGKHQEALVLLLKAYRDLTGVRGTPFQQIVSSRIKSLGREYPPATVALRDLRDAAMQRWQAKPDDRELVHEIAFLNDRLGDGRANLALYDMLPQDAQARQMLGLVAHKEFVEAQRYHDALVGKSFGNMVRELEMATRSAAGLKGRSEVNQRAFGVQGTLTNIEVLAGAGRADDARVLAEKLLAFDDSESTRAAVQRHLDRAASAPKP